MPLAMYSPLAYRVLFDALGKVLHRVHLANCFPFAYRNHVVPLAKLFPLAYRVLSDALGKVLHICLYGVISCPWQSASHVPIWCHIVPLANCFPFAYSVSFSALGKELPICL